MGETAHIGHVAPTQNPVQTVTQDLSFGPTKRYRSTLVTSTRVCFVCVSNAHTTTAFHPATTTYTATKADELHGVDKVCKSSRLRPPTHFRRRKPKNLVFYSCRSKKLWKRCLAHFFCPTQQQPFHHQQQQHRCRWSTQLYQSPSLRPRPQNHAFLCSPFGTCRHRLRRPGRYVSIVHR
jgi:hypothetical protein